LSSAAIPSFAPASWFSMLLLFGAHDEITPVTENSSMKYLRIPLSVHALNRSGLLAGMP
jgi:hypothetical protein